MTQTIKTTIIPSPILFNEIVTINEIVTMEVSQRVLIRKDENGYPSVYTPEVMSDKSFEILLEDLGPIVKKDYYICPDTLMTVFRGIIDNNGKQLYFSIDYSGNEIPVATAQRAFSTLKYMST
jgi:hypothetical protein